jgi:hypothetical protein
MNRRIVAVFFAMPLIALSPAWASPRADESDNRGESRWIPSVQFLGLTLHPHGGNTPEIYPLKLDKKAYLVLSVGAAANVDYRLNRRFFFRFTSSFYKDCAFVSAGCLHAGPRIQFSLGKNRMNAGMGPIFSFRQDWHRFRQFITDDFYGDRIYHGWQYRLFWTALELEYLRRINDTMEFQWSIIPGAPLIITSMFGVRFTPKIFD